MRIAYILYDGLTLLDFIGCYDPISRLQSMGFLPELKWDLCAMQGKVHDSFGLSLQVDVVQPDLSAYQFLFVPGGFGTRTLQKDQVFLDWLQSGLSVPLVASVCTGSLLLGAAGYLSGKKATTHFDEYASLAPMCEQVVKERIVEDRGVITAGAVASSLDVGLYLCRKWVGAENAELIRRRMDYSPH